MFDIIIWIRDTEEEFDLTSQATREEWVAAEAGASWATLYPEDIVMLVEV